MPFGVLSTHGRGRILLNAIRMDVVARFRRTRGIRSSAGPDGARRGRFRRTCGMRAVLPECGGSLQEGTVSFGADGGNGALPRDMFKPYPLKNAAAFGGVGKSGMEAGAEGGNQSGPSGRFRSFRISS